MVNWWKYNASEITEKVEEKGESEGRTVILISFMV